MPLTPLQESLDRTGSAFDQKLQQLVGMAQSVKASKMRKQQMANELAQQKDLIQYRSDVQLQQKKDYYEDVLKPQDEAEREFERLQNYSEALTKSKKETMDKIDAYSKKTVEAQHKDIHKYNLDEFEFVPSEVTDDEGKIVGFQPRVFYGGDEIPEMKYYDILGDISSMANDLASVDESSKQLQTFTDEETGILHLGNDSRGKQIIQQIKSDPEERKRFAQAWLDGNLTISNQEAESAKDGGKTRAGTLNAIMPAIDGIQQDLEGNYTDQQFKYADADIEDDWSIGGIFEDIEERSSTVDFTSTIGNVQRQLNDAVKVTLPKDTKFSIGDLTEAEQKMIISGEVDDEQLEAVAPEERANLVRRMANYNDQTREEFKRAFRYYNTYENVYTEYIQGTGERISRDGYMLDLVGGPKNLSNQEDLKKMIKRVGEDEETAKMIRRGQRYLNPNAKATHQLYNQ